MRDFSAVYKLPNVPAVYALYSSDRGHKYVAYVGIAGKLKQRIIQHVIRRDSSVATGTSDVNLNPDQIIGLSWWEHPEFENTVYLKAAELIAFELLNPALRSRAATDNAGSKLLSDENLQLEMENLFKRNPTRSIEFLSLSEAISKINQLENRVHELEAVVERLRRIKDES